MFIRATLFPLRGDRIDPYARLGHKHLALFEVALLVTHHLQERELQVDQIDFYECRVRTHSALVPWFDFEMAVDCLPFRA